MRVVDVVAAEAFGLDDEDAPNQRAALVALTELELEVIVAALTAQSTEGLTPSDKQRLDAAFRSMSELLARLRAADVQKNPFRPRLH